MCKSAIYATNTGAQSVVAGGQIDFGRIIRRFGQNFTLSGGNVVIDGSGYYDVIVNVAFEAVTAGELNVAIYSDGVQIPGAIVTVPGTADIVYPETIPALIRIKCCHEAIITVVPSEAITVTNAAIVVKKI